jgi:hypothetical protein
LTERIVSQRSPWSSTKLRGALADQPKHRALVDVAKQVAALIPGDLERLAGGLARLELKDGNLVGHAVASLPLGEEEDVSTDPAVMQLFSAHSYLYTLYECQESKLDSYGTVEFVDVLPVDAGGPGSTPPPFAHGCVCFPRHRRGRNTPNR